MTDWSVLVKCVADPAVPPVTDALRHLLLEALPGKDKWYQYPPASGRGNGFEVRFWLPANDATDAAQKGAKAVTDALRDLDLAIWTPVRIHAASLPARKMDAYPALESRTGNRSRVSVHVRVEFPDGRSLDEEQQTRIRSALADDLVLMSEAGVLEAKFWVDDVDAADGADAARKTVAKALEAARVSGGALTRVHSSTFDEIARLHYFGLVSR